MQNNIYPCLWFDGDAEVAANFYCSIFKDSKIVSKSPTVVIWELNGKRFMGLNGGPMFKFTEAISFVVDCKNQEEIDYYWNKLIAEGGQESRCGWLKDKFGVSWQIIPFNLGELMSDPSRSERVMAEIMKMNKLDIQKLLDA